MRLSRRDFVRAATAAAAAGLEEGDVITEFAGMKIRSKRDLQDIVEQRPIGSKRCCAASEVRSH